LARLKPPPQRLTSFYLIVSAGGAWGGIFVGLICPQLFSSFLELNLGLVGAFMLAMGVLWDDLWQTWLLRRIWSKYLVFALGFGLLFVVVRAQFETIRTGYLAVTRNFYGVLAVREHFSSDPQWHLRELLNGRILHGSQFQAEEKRMIPTTYYNTESGIGVTLRQFQPGRPRRVAIVGLGTGTISAYGERGDTFSFYEIDPHVVHMSQTYFTYLAETYATVRILMGDARLSLERQPPQNYDILVLDAFTGDAIPAHLLTREAFTLYLRHLSPEGVIAVHTSNRYLDLTPVIGGLAKHFALDLRRIEYVEDDRISAASSDWMLLTNNRRFLSDPLVQQRATHVEGTYQPIRLWTDQYSNLLQILE
jgi:hypothetical protein